MHEIDTHDKLTREFVRSSSSANTFHISHKHTYTSSYEEKNENENERTSGRGARSPARPAAQPVPERARRAHQVEDSDARGQHERARARAPRRQQTAASGLVHQAPAPHHRAAARHAPQGDRPAQSEQVPERNSERPARGQAQDERHRLRAPRVLAAPPQLCGVRRALHGAVAQGAESEARRQGGQSEQDARRHTPLRRPGHGGRAAGQGGALAARQSAHHTDGVRPRARQHRHRGQLLQALRRRLRQPGADAHRRAGDGARPHHRGQHAVVERAPEGRAHPPRRLLSQDQRARTRPTQRHSKSRPTEQEDLPGAFSCLDCVAHSLLFGAFKSYLK